MKTRQIPVEIQRTDTRTMEFKLSHDDIEWLVATALAERLQLTLSTEGVSYVYRQGLHGEGGATVVITQDYSKLPQAPGVPFISGDIVATVGPVIPRVVRD